LRTILRAVATNFGCEATNISLNASLPITPFWVPPSWRPCKMGDSQWVDRKYFFLGLNAGRGLLPAGLVRATKFMAVDA
jgi:hypothetical protein